ncbi:hypothetical protein GCM10010353_67440 [Streptomyces chryseus]|nr:hypothetical protein GCM10010353_67440 [Streptomyces chryseus]
MLRLPSPPHPRHRGENRPLRRPEALVQLRFKVAWAEGLAAARGWAAAHGHLLAPLDAALPGRSGRDLAQEPPAAARKAQEIALWRAEGLPVESSAGAMTRERREQLEEIDPSWCPMWPATWQRCFHLVRQHLDGGEALPTTTGEVVRQGECRRVGHLGPVRLGPAHRRAAVDVRAGPRYRARQRGEEAEAAHEAGDKWAVRLTAAEQFFGREGHLTVPRKHVETITLGGDGQAPRSAAA